MLASTSAGLVPPYLTIPLTNRVLVPFESGAPANYHLLAMYLTGMLGAALLAWVLGVSRTYVLAWVSERIAADMRTPHLCPSAKAVARILRRQAHRRPDEPHRHRHRPDLHLPVGQPARLLHRRADDRADHGHRCFRSIRCWPWSRSARSRLIAWLIHGVRSRLRRGFDQGGRALARMTSVLADTIPGIRVVKAFAQEQREIDRFRRANDGILDANDRVNSTWSFFGPRWRC